MSEESARSLDRLRRLVECCDRFEAACTAGRVPVPEDFREVVPSTEWSAVREELELLRRAYDAAADESEASGRAGEARGPSSGGPTDDWSRRDEATVPGTPARVEDLGSLPAGTRVGDCEVLSRIGAGGMGVVYRARQRTTKIDRLVALKLIRRDDGWDRADGRGEEADRRFTNETLAAGRLDHEHIVKVFEAGEWLGRPYFTMFLVEGRSLSVALREGPLSNELAARVMEPVARAVGHAHAQKIIHRDLKPSNILLDASGKPYVTDFGLAKLLERFEPLTLSGQILGTAPYMSPEQAARPASVREAGDIYSLGATLYEMLTGRPPFRASELAETLRQAKYDLPAPPRRLDPAISRDLETICLKCLEKDPARRYASADDLADELARVLRKEPIRARPISPLGRAARWVHRHPAIAALVLAILVVGMAGFLSTAIQLQRARRALALVERGSYYDEIALAAQALAVNQFDVADQQLARTGEGLRRWEYHYLKRLAAARRAGPPPAAGPFPVQAGGLYAATFHPDGSRFATGGRLAPVRIWDPAGREPPVDLDGVSAGSYVDDLEWVRGPLVNHLAAGTRDGAVHAWDEASGRFSGHRSAPRHEGAVTDLSVHPGGRELASAGEDGRVLVSDVADLRATATVRDRGPAVRSIRYHPGGAWLAIGGDDREVALWDASGRGRVRVLGSLGESVGALAFSPDGRYLAAGDSGGTIRIWDLRDGTATTLSAYFDGVNALAFTPDGSRLASAGADGVVKIWDVSAGREVLKLPGHTDQVDALSFRRDGAQLLSVDVDGGIRLWDATPWDRPPPPRPVDLRGHTKLVVTLAASPDGDRLASAGPDEEILVWDVPGRRVAARLAGHRGRVNGLAFDATGRRLASAGRDGTLRIWDPTTAREVARYDSGGDRLTSVAFSPSERRVAFAGTRGDVRLWDCEPGHEPTPLGEHRDEVYAVAYHPRGHLLATAGAEGVVRLWDADRGVQVGEFAEHAKSIDSLAFSPDGAALASASHDKTLRVRDLETGVSRPLLGHDSRIWRLAYSADGRLLASVDSAGSVLVWDVATGRLRATLLGHTSRLLGVAFDPRGRYLASAGGDTLIKLWDPKAWGMPPR